MGAEAAIFSWHFCLEICQESQNPVYPNGKEIKLVWKRSTDMTERLTVKHMVLGAFFLALGMILPFFTGQIPAVGSMLLPMHIPVLLCGYVCGWQWGLLVGLVAPLLRSAVWGMPPMMPVAAAMAFELAAYGAVTGFLYGKMDKSPVSIYISLLSAMAAGRIVWGVVSVFLYGIMGKAFSVSLFLSGALFTAIPGIVLQLVLIPVIVASLEKARVIK